MDTVTPLLLHVHIYKNAGTSLLAALKRSFSAVEEIEPADDEGTLSVGQMEESLAANPTLSVISSHRLTTALPSTLAGRPVVPLLLMRDPISRIGSMHRFARLEGREGAIEKLAKRQDLDRWVKTLLLSGYRQLLCNNQVRVLVGSEIRDEDPFPEHLGTRVCEIARQLPFVGLVERLEESLAIWEYKLRPRFPDIDLSVGRENTSRDESQSTLAPHVREALDAQNRWDYAVWDLVHGRIDDEARRIPNWVEHLRDFKARCGVRTRGLGHGVRIARDVTKNASSTYLGRNDRTTPATIVSACLLTGEGAACAEIAHSETVRVSITVAWNVNVASPLVGFTLRSIWGHTVACVHTERIHGTPTPTPAPATAGSTTTYQFTFEVPRLNQGGYYFDLAVAEGTESCHRHLCSAPSALLVTVGDDLHRFLPGSLDLNSSCVLQTIPIAVD